MADYVGMPIKQQDLVLCNLRVTALIYETKREGGRRIVVRDHRDNIMYDTNDCYDLANAVHLVSVWMAEESIDFAESEKAAAWEEATQKYRQQHPEM